MCSQSVAVDLARYFVPELSAEEDSPAGFDPTFSRVTFHHRTMGLAHRLLPFVTRQHGMTRMKVRFTGQQLVLIDKIVAEATMGTTREEVIRAMFRQYVLQTLGGAAR
jgi:hypothetical protein